MTRATAYHEAGHAAAACVLGLEFHAVTIASTDEYDGAVIVRPMEPGERVRPEVMPELPRLRPETRHAFEPIVKYKLAGAVAESGAMRRYDYVAMRTDVADAERFAVKAATGGGWAEWLAFLWALTVDLILGHWPAVEAIAEALAERRTLTHAEVRELFDRSTGQYGEPRIVIDLAAMERASRVRRFLTKRRPRLDLALVPFVPVGGTPCATAPSISSAGSPTCSVSPAATS